MVIFAAEYITYAFVGVSFKMQHSWEDSIYVNYATWFSKACSGQFIIYHCKNQHVLTYFVLNLAVIVANLVLIDCMVIVEASCLSVFFHLHNVNNSFAALLWDSGLTN